MRAKSNGPRTRTIAYCPQDSTDDFDSDLNLFDWMSQWRKPGHDDLMVRGMLGRSTVYRR